MTTLLLGDSLTAWNDWQEVVGPHLNHALPGESTDGLLYRLHRSLSTFPERVILLIGTNDLLQHTPVEMVIHNYTQILSELLEVKQLFVLSVPPVAAGVQTAEVNAAINTFNAWLQEQLWKYGFKYVDLHAALSDPSGGIDPRCTTDGIHLTPEGYARWETLLAEAIEAADSE